jgi:hypothetical protein
MVRVSRNLRHAACLIICAGLAGCGSSSGDDDGAQDRPDLISFDADPAQPAHKGYSAFDGNAHDYQLTPNVPSAADMPSNTNPDPIVPSSIQWTVDDGFLKKESFNDIPNSILVTTKKAGTTTIKITATTKAGTKVKSSAMLEISQANADEWAVGDARYNNGMMINWGDIFMQGRMQAQAAMMGGATSMGSCGLPFSFGDAIPKTSACGNCHDNSSGITVEHTPAQTAGYSDDDLVQIFTMGKKPAGYMFTSNILKYVPMPDCVYATFHTWDIDDMTKKGIVWKLRSIKPMKAAPPPDPAQLAAQFRMMMMNNGGQMPAGDSAGGAAGSGM